MFHLSVLIVCVCVGLCVNVVTDCFFDSHEKCEYIIMISVRPAVCCKGRGGGKGWKVCMFHLICTRMCLCVNVVTDCVVVFLFVCVFYSHEKCENVMISAVCCKNFNIAIF